MPPPASPPGAPPDKKRQRQQLMLFAAVGAVVVVLMLTRGGNQPAQAQPDPNQLTAPGVTPSTYADNGAQAAALGDSVTQALQDQGTAFQNLADAIGGSQGKPGIDETGAQKLNARLDAQKKAIRATEKQDKALAAKLAAQQKLDKRQQAEINRLRHPKRKGHGTVESSKPGNRRPPRHH